MKNKSVIFFSVGAALLITALILVLSFTAQPTTNKTTQLGGQISDADIVLKAENVEGCYVDQSDGWYYEFEFSPSGDYDGTFSAGFDEEHSASQNSAHKNFTTVGEWKVQDGQIKLYSQGIYRSSMWYYGAYLVDGVNYFEGKISKGETLVQTVLVSKAQESGDTQIFNLYSDGKLIVEIIRNDGKNDTLGSDLDLPLYQMAAGNYVIENDEIIITVGQSSQKYYILDNAIAKWKYVKNK